MKIGNPVILDPRADLDEPLTHRIPTGTRELPTRHPIPIPRRLNKQTDYLPRPHSRYLLGTQISTPHRITPRHKRHRHKNKPLHDTPFNDGLIPACIRDPYKGIRYENRRSNTPATETSYHREPDEHSNLFSENGSMYSQNPSDETEYAQVVLPYQEPDNHGHVNH